MVVVSCSFLPWTQERCRDNNLAAPGIMLCAEHDVI
jgi:hypothetical protein